MFGRAAITLGIGPHSSFNWILFAVTFLSTNTTKVEKKLPFFVLCSVYIIVRYRIIF